MKPFRQTITVLLTAALLLPLGGCFGGSGELLTECTSGIVTEPGTDAPEMPHTRLETLQVNGIENPVGTDESPVFSWCMTSEERGKSQSAYRVLVADNEEDLKNGVGNLWDSGKTEGSASAGIAYAGKLLTATARYYWTVTAWDEDGKEVKPAQTAYFETGLGEAGFGRADWIQQHIPDDTRLCMLNDANWIWFTGGASQGNLAATTQYFRFSFTTAPEKKISRAYLTFTADDYGVMYVNGKAVKEVENVQDIWKTANVCDITGNLVTGENVVAASIVNKITGYAGLLARVSVIYTDGSEESYVTDATWKVTAGAPDSFMQPAFDDSGWKIPDQVIPYGDGAWENNVTVPLTVAGTEGSAPMLRRPFETSSSTAVVCARIYATAVGVYDLWFNGTRLGNAVLTPGLSEYKEHISVQTYDVTALVKSGENVLGSVLGRGWFFLDPAAARKTKIPAFVCKMVIRYEDGTEQVILSDRDWTSTVEGPITENDLFDGETYDASKESDGWSAPGYAATGWEPVSVSNAPALGVGEIVMQPSGNITVMETLQPIAVTSPKKGVFIYDFGQNFAGVVQITVKGNAGQTVTLRHGEMLNDKSGTGDGPVGTLYTANLRSAAATDRYTLRGDADGETWSPTMTFHGFRYVEITGINEALPLDAVKGLVLYSDMETTGSFSCSEPLLNKLASNALWGQKSNFLSIPTDSPQRDERMGWAGDAQIFAGTAAYHMDVRAFYERYVTALNDGQYENGAYPDIAPLNGRPAFAHMGYAGNNGWADAGIIIPYTVYKQYGDLSLIDTYYDNMARYIGYLVSVCGKDYVRRNSNGYGDWLAVSESTPMELCDTAYCVYVTDLMASMAAATGHDADAASFRETAQKFRDGWCKNFLKADGSTTCGSQTSYILGLHFGIIPQDLREAAADKLVTNIKRNQYHLTTGFMGVSYLLPVLCETGHEDIAFRLLEQESYPSWLYPVLQGATTIWERWNSYTVENGFGDVNMNSFNHYSYGSVVGWFYTDLLGIRPDDENPAFSHVVLHPTVGGKMTRARGSYRSVHGLIESGWQLTEDGNLVYTCTVPANTTATLELPVTGETAQVTEGTGTVKASQAEGVTEVGYKNGRMVYTLTSGTYVFTTRAN